MVDMMAQLDCLISFAESSRNFNFTRFGARSDAVIQLVSLVPIDIRRSQLLLTSLCLLC